MFMEISYGHACLHVGQRLVKMHLHAQLVASFFRGLVFAFSLWDHQREAKVL
jgi:hypothetical protein